MNFIVSKYKQILLFILIFLISYISYAVLNSYDPDNLWNFGVSYSMANGLIPYKDFNLLTFPFSNFITLLFMSILGKKMIAYYIMCSFFLLLTLIIINKLNKDTFFIILFIVLGFSFSSYNIICLFLCLLLMYLEVYNQKSKYHNFITGLITGLLIINKQSMVVFLLPLLINKDFKQILQSSIGILIPLACLFIWLLINNNVINFINYTILGVIDFGSKNSKFSFFIIIWAAILIYNIYMYIKSNKNNKWLYSMCFLIIDVPLFDLKHSILSFIPTIVNTTIFYKNNRLKKQMLFIQIFAILFIFIGLTILWIADKNSFINTNYQDVYFMTSESKLLNHYVEQTDALYNKYKDDYNIYFMDDLVYLYKIKNNIPINKFDMTLYGNNGYNGTEKLIKEIEKMDNDTVFIVGANRKETTQHNYRLSSYITSNFKKIDSNRFSNVYQKS